MPSAHLIRRLAGVAATALALAPAAVTLGAEPASAAGCYLVTHTIPVSGLGYGIAVDSAIHVRYNPNLVAADPSTHTLDVGTGHIDGTLSVINETPNRITSTLDIGTPVRGLAVDPAAGLGYLTSRGLMFVIDLASNTVVAQLHVPGGVAAAVDPAHDTAYVTSASRVYVIQPCP